VYVGAFGYLLPSSAVHCMWHVDLTVIWAVKRNFKHFMYFIFVLWMKQFKCQNRTGFTDNCSSTLLFLYFPLGSTSKYTWQDKMIYFTSNTSRFCTYRVSDLLSSGVVSQYSSRYLRQNYLWKKFCLIFILFVAFPCTQGRRKCGSIHV